MSIPMHDAGSAPKHPGMSLRMSPTTSTNYLLNSSGLEDLLRIQRPLLQLLLNKRLLLKNVSFLQPLLGYAPKVITITIQKKVYCYRIRPHVNNEVSLLLSQFQSQQAGFQLKLLAFANSFNKRYKIINFIFIFVQPFHIWCNVYFIEARESVVIQVLFFPNKK